MASIIKKKIKGNTYYYAVQSGWKDGKSRIIWQKYLGKADDIVKALSKDPVKPVEVICFEFGASATLYSIANQLKLVETIDRHTNKRKQGPSVGQYMLIAAINRAIAPTSKRRIGEWFSSSSLQNWLPVKPKHLSSQRFWDHMGYLDSEAIKAIEAELTARMVKEFNLDLRCLVYDTTNFFTWIDTMNDSELPQRGHNKAKRNDLKQVGLSMMVTTDFHIPLFHKVYPGNRTDSKQFGSVTEELVERLRLIKANCQDITLVYDKGNNSKKNQKQIDNSPFSFVGSLVPSQHPDLLAVPRCSFTPLQGANFGGVFAYRTRKMIMGVERTVVVTFNEALYLGQLQGILLQLRKANEALRELQKKLCNRANAGKKRGKPPTVASVQNQVKKILTSSSAPLSRLIRTEVKEVDANVQLEYSIDHDALDNYKDNYLGKSILFTDREDWSTGDIVSAYRGQSHIEDAFKRMKDPHFLSWSPQYHWTDQKIEVHAFYCVLALTLTTLARRKAVLAGVDISIPKMLEELANIKNVAHIYPKDSKQKDCLMLTKRNEIQQKLMEIMGIEQLHRDIC
jgi:transposase